MNISALLIVFFAGLIGGASTAPLKGIKNLQYEHWGLILCLFGYVIFPWAILFCTCPDTLGALAELPLKPLLIGNAFSLAWGVANILYLICMVKIGFCLAQGILVGIAIPAGVLIPMVLKGSGKFANAPDIFSISGLFIVFSVLLMLTAVVLLSKAGFGRERALSPKTRAQSPEPKALKPESPRALESQVQSPEPKAQRGQNKNETGRACRPATALVPEQNSALRTPQFALQSLTSSPPHHLTSENSALRTHPSAPNKNFSTYLIMSILAGLFSIGISFSFVYTEELISTVFARHGMNPNFTPAAVRAVTITGGGILNVIYPLYLLTKNRSWKGFACEHNVREMIFAIIIAALAAISVVMASTGQIMLGKYGSSVGFGIGQSIILASTQCVAFISGEWRGVPKKYVRQVIIAMILLFSAVGVISVLS